MRFKVEAVLCCSLALLAMARAQGSVSQISFKGNSFQCKYNQPSSYTPVEEGLTTIQECNVSSAYSSCLDALTRCGYTTSDWYTIRADNGSLVSVYCDMKGTKCDGTGGWMRVANVDMNVPSTQCPGAWREYFDNDSGLRLCIKNFSGCASAYYYTHGVPYTQVCGQVKGYQFGSNNGFGPYNGNSAGISADGRYVDGISITHSNPRIHIWAYVIGFSDNDTDWDDCPCNLGSRGFIPTYVGNAYYCESGLSSDEEWEYVLYSDDVLWDGEQCENLEGPCCTNTKMPWFLKDLERSVSADIEARLCTNENNLNEATAVEVFELYIR